MIDFCHVAVGYVVLLPCFDGADSPPIGLPIHHREAKRNYQLTICAPLLC